MRVKALHLLIDLVFIGITVLVFYTCAGCSQPTPMPPTTPTGGPGALCENAPIRIYYGSCGAKQAPGPASCALCQGARGCTAFPGLYCVNGLSCDDPACK